MEVIAGIKSSIERVIPQLRIFHHDILPAALKNMYWCETSIRDAVKLAMKCEIAMQTFPTGLIETHLKDLNRLDPKSCESSSSSMDISLFRNACEHLYSNFAQNYAISGDTLNSVEKIMEELLGRDRLLFMQQKTKILFSSYDDLVGALHLFPRAANNEIDAQCIGLHLSTLSQDEALQKKVVELICHDFTHRNYVLLMLCSSSDTTLKHRIRNCLQNANDSISMISRLLLETNQDVVVKAVHQEIKSGEGAVMILFTWLLKEISLKANFVDRGSSYEWNIDHDNITFDSLRSFLPSLKEKSLSLTKLKELIMKQISTYEAYNSLFIDDLFAAYQ